MSIHTGNQTLRSSLFISGGTIDLSGKIKIPDSLQLKSRLKLGRVKVVIFHCIGRSVDLGIFKTLDSMQCIHLNIERK